MGLFKSKEKKEKSVAYMGETLEPIGKIPVKAVVGLTLKSDDKVLNIHHDKINITLPFDRILSFKTESETDLKKAGNSLGGALIGGVIGGGVGAVIGAGKNKGKTDIKWFSTLTYKDKDGQVQELHFIDYGLTGYYSGESQHWGYMKFAQELNNIAVSYADDITEL